MTTDDESHIIRTTSKRLVKGLVIIIGIMIVGTVIAVSQWEHMHSVPPQSSKLKPEVDLSNPPGGHAAPVAPAKSEAPAAAKPKADATLTILEGAATQGSPDYKPDQLTVKKVIQYLLITLDVCLIQLRTVKDASDATSGKLFDTSIINGGEFKVLETTNVDAGAHPFYCTVHPYMTGTLTVE